MTLMTGQAIAAGGYLQRSNSSSEYSEPQRTRSQVEAQCVALSGLLDMQSNQLDALEQRLGRVLRRSLTENAATTPTKLGPPEPVLVEHASELRGFAQRIEIANHRLADIQNNLEL